jgi:hypothetical protein
VIGGMTYDKELKWPKVRKSTELFYPEVNQWHLGPSLTTPRLYNTATLMTGGPDAGKVLVIGGYHASLEDNGTSLASSELLDPRTGDVDTSGDLEVGRHWHVAIETKAGRILVAGGTQWYRGHELGILDSSEIYDPKKRKWTRTQKTLNHHRFLPTAVVLKTGPHKGKVLVVGGFDKLGVYPDIKMPALSSCEVYHPKNGPEDGYWEEVDHLTTPRGNHTLTLLEDGRVLAAGGVSELGGNPTTYRSYEIYDPVQDKWSCPTDHKEWNRLRQYRAGHTATLLDDNATLLVSGFTSELYDPISKTWAFTGGTLRQYRTGHTATILSEGKHKGKVVVAGGEPRPCELFQPPSE